jgi:hypothetical protein
VVLRGDQRESRETAAGVDAWSQSSKQLHPKVYEPIFERLRNPNLAESFLSITLLTQVPLATIDRWQKEFRFRPDWLPNRHPALQNRRIFTKGDETQIVGSVTESFICRRVLLTLEILCIIVTAKRQ